MKSYLDAIEIHGREIERIRQSVKKAILDLPDNPKIQKISEHPKCFTMSAKDIFGADESYTDMRVKKNLNIFYHDFKAQYKKITEIIDKAKPNEVVAIINSIISTHKWNSTEFHPDAIRNLENILLN